MRKETYRGSDAGKVFLEKILQEEKRILKLMDASDKKIIFTFKDGEVYDATEPLYIFSKKTL